jgi:hypothetical protein
LGWIWIRCKQWRECWLLVLNGTVPHLVYPID